MRAQDLSRLPPTISVEEAAGILGVSRGTAFNMAREFLARGNGLPVLRCGRRLVVPVPRLLEMLGVRTAEAQSVPAQAVKGREPSRSYGASNGSAEANTAENGI